LNAFFAAAELAIVSVNKNRIKLMAEDGNKTAGLLLELIEKPTKFLSTIQVGITLAGFFSSASAAAGISGDLALFLDRYRVPYSEQIALVAVTLALSYISLVFGELFPKRIALQKSEAIALFSTRPILFLSKLAVPFVKLLSFSTNLLAHLAGLGEESTEEMVSREEIRSLVEVGQERGVINETEKEMIEGIFEFDDKLAYEVMTPRTYVYMIDIEKPLSEYLDELIESRYSRIPVYEGDTDNIIGILYMKDFFIEARKKGFENVDIRGILRKPYFVPERKNIDELFKELQVSRRHIAVLIDEYGGFSGIVTIEDLIEEVMGNITDEYDDDEPKIKEIDSGTYMVSGTLSIEEFNDFFNTDLQSEDYDTISGLIIDLLGHIPRSADEKTIEYENFVFKINKIKGKRIDNIIVYVLSEEKPEKEES